MLLERPEVEGKAERPKETADVEEPPQGDLNQTVVEQGTCGEEGRGEKGRGREEGVRRGNAITFVW